MDALTCRFADEVRLYQRLEQPEARLFVPSEQPISAGESIEITIAVGCEPPLSVRGVVVGKRTERGAPAGSAGLWVRLPNDATAALRRDLESRQALAERTSLRRAPRYRRALRVVVGSPFTRVSRTVDVGKSGACIADLLPGAVDVNVPMVIDFGEARVRLFGRLRWKNEELRQTGVEFWFQEPSMRSLLARAVAAIALEEARQPPRSESRLALVADRDPEVESRVRALLGARGWSIVTAGSGPEALLAARRIAPGIIILGAELPGMAGLEVARALQQDAQTRVIPVMLLTAGPVGAAIERLESLLGRLRSVEERAPLPV